MAVGTWKFDPFHTQVEFSAKHFGMMTVRGNFHEVVAGGEIFPDDPSRSKIEATINTASIRTHNEQRDNDLRSSNFLEIDKYPTMTFNSTKVEHVEGDRSHQHVFDPFPSQGREQRPYRFRIHAFPQSHAAAAGGQPNIARVLRKVGPRMTPLPRSAATSGTRPGRSSHRP